MNRVRRHWKGLLASGVLLLAVLVVGVPYAYIHFIEGDQPAALNLSDVPTAAAPPVAGSAVPVSPVSDVSGTWTVASGSQAGYRVKETLAGQHTTAVGRTTAVTGSLTISGTRVTAVRITVQMAQVGSDRSQRDSQFRGSIMDTTQYPTGTFVLTTPIELHSVPAIGRTITATATGNLTLHGTTNRVRFTVQAKRLAASVAVTGQIPITYSQYHISNPSRGGFVSVGETGTVEFLLVTTKS